MSQFGEVYTVVEAIKTQPKPVKGKPSAAMFPLIEFAKANGVEPYAYLQYVIGHIAAADTDEALDALMPWKTLRAFSA